MTPDMQVPALIIMFCIGGFSMLFLVIEWASLNPRFRIALAVWSVFWAAPPLIGIWLKGVMG
jgi:hypothetical protein